MTLSAQQHLNYKIISHPLTLLYGEITKVCVKITESAEFHGTVARSYAVYKTGQKIPFGMHNAAKLEERISKADHGTVASSWDFRIVISNDNKNLSAKLAGFIAAQIENVDGLKLGQTHLKQSEIIIPSAALMKMTAQNLQKLSTLASDETPVEDIVKEVKAFDLEEHPALIGLPIARSARY